MRVGLGLKTGCNMELISLKHARRKAEGERPHEEGREAPIAECAVQHLLPPPRLFSM